MNSDPSDPPIIAENVTYKTWKCRVRLSVYTHPPQPIALMLEAACRQLSPYNGHEEIVYEGESIAVATVFVDGAELAPDEVLIKSWEENEGMAETLQAHGVIGPELRRVPTGFVEATVHKLIAMR